MSLHFEGLLTSIRSYLRQTYQPPRQQDYTQHLVLKREMIIQSGDLCLFLNPIRTLPLEKTSRQDQQDRMNRPVSSSSLQERRGITWRLGHPLKGEGVGRIYPLYKQKYLETSHHNFEEARLLMLLFPGTTTRHRSHELRARPYCHRTCQEIPQKTISDRLQKLIGRRDPVAGGRLRLW